MKRKVKIGDNIRNAFNKMIGVDDIDEYIVSNNYDSLRERLISFLDILENIHRTNTFDLGEELDTFLLTSRSILADTELVANMYTTDLRDINNSDNVMQSLIDRMKVCKYNKDQLITAYNTLKDTDPLLSIVGFINIISGKIKIYRENHPCSTDIEAICDEMFVFNTNGILFPFSRYDFRGVFIRRGDEELRPITIRAIKILYAKAKEVLDEVSKPNISPEEYITVIEEAVANARKMAPRCDDAFDLMMNSLTMFRQKFNDYYKLFLTSGNPSIILTEFIKDVSEDVAVINNPELKRQFVKIYDTVKSRMAKTGVDSNAFSIVSEVGAIFQDI